MFLRYEIYKSTDKDVANLPLRFQPQEEREYYLGLNKKTTIQFAYKILNIHPGSYMQKDKKSKGDYDI